MSQKLKIILIVVLVLGALLIGVYFYNKSRGVGTDPNATVYQKFNPFGTSTKVPVTTKVDPNTGEQIIDDTGIKQTEIIKLHKLTDFAVAGATYFEETKPIIASTETVIPTTADVVKNNPIKNDILGNVKPSFELIPSLRYVEKSTGHIYQMTINTKSAGKISNSTVPSVNEVIFDGKADSLIYRYVSFDNTSITSFITSIKNKTGFFLSSDITNISLSPDKNAYFTIIKNTNGVNGFINYFDNTKSSKVFTSPFSEWSSQWSTLNTIFLTTKPSYLVEGSIFSLNTKTNTLSKIFGEVYGLTTLANNDGTKILFGASLEKGPKLNTFDIKNHTSTDLDTYGLPEKCVWSINNIYVYCAVPNTVIGTQYPDSWYQGLISFDDRFIKINTVTKEVTTLTNSSSSNVNIDGTNLFLDKNESNLFFINKKDGTLWSLDL